MHDRLNSIQKSMLQWNEMHPYSAIHVVQVRAAHDATRLRHSIDGTLMKRGLTRLSLDHEQFTFQYEGGAAECEIRTIDGAGGPISVIVAEMERQLNLRFDHNQRFSPFRFMVVPSSDCFFLGLVYFHPVADAESVVYLLKDIVTNYLAEVTSDVTGSPLDLHCAISTHPLRRHPMVLVHKVLALPVQMRNMRESHRPGYKDPDNLANGFVSFSLAPEALRSVVAAAKSWGVTVNDLFMALLMKALSPCAGLRTQARRRRKITIGCITNIRKDLGVDSRRTFGLFLGSFTVTHEVPAGISLHELAGDICQQTSRIKRHKLYLAMALELGLARLLLKFFSPGRRKKFYAKYYPLWGGITNMNLNSLWEQSGSGGMVDYFRGVSTGPITPLALSVTTVGDHANLGLSYRTSVFSRNDIEGLEGRFREHLEETRRIA